MIRAAFRYSLSVLKIYSIRYVYYRFSTLAVNIGTGSAPFDHSLIDHSHSQERERPVWPRSRLTTATHSSRCLGAFPCSSTISGWWSIGTWSNGPHPQEPMPRGFSLFKRCEWLVVKRIPPSEPLDYKRN